MMLVLIPFPSAFAIAPTLVNAVRYAGNGMMRQLFGDVMVPVEQVNGAPRLMNLSELTFKRLSALHLPRNGAHGSR